MNGESRVQRGLKQGFARRGSDKKRRRGLELMNEKRSRE